MTDKNGLLLVRIDRERLIEDLKDKTPLQTYSLTDIKSDNYICNLRISKGSYYFDYKHKDGVWYDMQMTNPGLHNVENAVAALSVCNFALQ